MRAELASKFPTMFPMTSDDADARELCDVILCSDNRLMSKVYHCSSCNINIDEAQSSSYKVWHCSKSVWNRKA